MQIRAQVNDRILYMELYGEIDQHNAVRARQTVDRYADDYAMQSERAVFDLENVSFMDSTGIGFLIGRYKKFQRYGVPMYVTNPSQSTDKILSMSGVYTLIPRI